MKYRNTACLRSPSWTGANRFALSRPGPSLRTWIGLGIALFSIAGQWCIGATDDAEALRVQSPPSARAVKAIEGYVGERIRANTEGYLKPFDIDRYTRMVEEKRHRDWWWIGEQPGKWLESAVLTSRQSGDTGLEQRARAVLERLNRAQEADGYLGITAAEVRTPAQPLRGMDPYEQYFMLHGLLTAAEEWHETNALNTARKLGNYFVTHIGPGKAEFWPSPLRPPLNVNTIICPQLTWVPEGTPKAATLYVHSEIAGHTAHYGWEGTLLIDPMLRLYQATGDPAYLEWSQWVVANIDRWSGWDAFSKLDAVADGKLGIHQLQPYVHAHTFQMNFLGLLRLYEITRDPSLLRKVRGAWDDIARRQLYVTGGVSVGEHYAPGYHRPLTGEVVETCANMSWLELTQDLLELTGEARYADVIERLLLNHVFAAQTVDGDCYRYHTPPNGFKPDDYFHGPDCCTGSGHRVVSMLPRFLYGQGPDGLYVNQYVPSTVQLKIAGGADVVLKVVTRYPEESAVLITVNPEKPTDFALHVRLPGWCERPTLSVNGRPLDTGTAGTYARLARTWDPGDTVQLSFPMTPRWIEHDHWTDGAPPHALERGPVVYALDTVWWNDPAVPAPVQVGTDIGWLGKQTQFTERGGTRGALGPFYEVPVELLDGRRARACFVPFSNIGRWYRSGEKKPERHSRAFSYAVWIQDRASVSFQRARRELSKATVPGPAATNAVRDEVAASPASIRPSPSPATAALDVARLRNPVWVSADNLRDPSVLQVPGGYRLFYSRLSGTNWGSPASWSIASVFTRDFVRFENNRNVSPEGHASPGDVVEWHGRFVLPYQSYPSVPTQLCFSESADLEVWTAPKPFLTEARFLSWNTLRRVIDPTLVRDGETLHCYFVGSANVTNAAGKPLRANLLGHALTRDPKLANWEILSPNLPSLGVSERAPDGVENVMIFRTGDHWTMIYSEGLSNQHLALATSTDLSAWSCKGPVELPRQKWMARKYGAPFVWREPNQWLMILMGESAAGRTAFGLLTSPDGEHWTALPE